MEYKTDSLNKMNSEISGFADDLEQALSVKTNIFRKYRHILISGMGASMIGGTIFSGSAYYFSDISVDVTKTMSLPAWRDRDTLFVSCSYSGNTYETLRNYTMAKDAGLDVVAVTHCGKLKELAEKNGDILVPIGGKPMQPRSAIGWFVGLIGGIIEDAGGPALRKELTNMLPDLRRYRDEIDDPCGGEAWKVARTICGRVSVVYDTPDLGATTVRMKNQLNENSKMIAFSGVLPEFNHNEIVGWYDDSRRKDFVPIIFNSQTTEEISGIVKATVSTLASRGVEAVVVDVKGKSVLEKISMR